VSLDATNLQVSYQPSYKFWYSAVILFLFLVVALLMMFGRGQASLPFSYVHQAAFDTSYENMN